MASERVLLATIGAAHGVKGEVRVKSHTAEPTALGEYGPVSTKDGRRFEIERLRPGKGDMLVAKFRGIDERNAAEALNGLALYVERGALPEPEDDEFYHADLIGLAAVDPSGATLGKVVAAYDFGAGDILDIQAESGASLQVPFTKAAVPVVDIPGRRLTVILPEEVEAKDEPTEGEDS